MGKMAFGLYRLVCAQAAAAAAFSAMAVAGPQTAAALDKWATAAAASSDQLCDYCQDYTQAITTSDPVRSAWVAGTGYKSESDAAVVAMPSRDLSAADLPEVREALSAADTGPLHCLVEHRKAMHTLFEAMAAERHKPHWQFEPDSD